MRRSALQGRPVGRFLSRDECQTFVQHVIKCAKGGGHTDLFLESQWAGNLRWARNQIISSGDVRDNDVGIARMVRGAVSRVQCNQVDEVYAEAAVRRAERLLLQRDENPETMLEQPYTEPFTVPPLWFDHTYQLEAVARAEVMQTVVVPALQAGMLSAGYLQVSAAGRAVMNSQGRNLYEPYTQAQYSVTVRDPAGTGSGWAGVDWNDWGRIDAAQLSATALDKCLRSRNPVRIEPGRYVTILEPQAVADFVAPLFDWGLWNRKAAERRNPPTPFSGDQPGTSKLGWTVVDRRLTIGSDPMDPDCSFLPFGLRGVTETDLPVYHAVNWIEQGVLKALAYDRQWGIENLGVNTGLPDRGAFRMSGGTTSVAQMITTTVRGLIVTRFSEVNVLDMQSTLAQGYTRDGVWLIEKGKVSKPVKNLEFTMPILAALNNVLELGPPQRVFRPQAPTVVPPLKLEDFNFTSLSDAI